MFLGQNQILYMYVKKHMLAGFFCKKIDAWTLDMLTWAPRVGTYVDNKNEVFKNYQPMSILL